MWAICICNRCICIFNNRHAHPTSEVVHTQDPTLVLVHIHTHIDKYKYILHKLSIPRVHVGLQGVKPLQLAGGQVLVPREIRVAGRALVGGEALGDGAVLVVVVGLVVQGGLVWCFV